MVGRAVRWNVSILVAALLVTLGGLAFGGSEAPEPMDLPRAQRTVARDALGQSILIIDFASHPRSLEGAEVVIDGNVVGRLTRSGVRAQSDFVVQAGPHEIMLRHHKFRSVTKQIATGGDGERVMLLADVDPHPDGAQLALWP